MIVELVNVFVQSFSLHFYQSSLCLHITSFTWGKVRRCLVKVKKVGCCSIWGNILPPLALSRLSSRLRSADNSLISPMLEFQWTMGEQANERIRQSQLLSWISCHENHIWNDIVETFTFYSCSDSSEHSWCVTTDIDRWWKGMVQCTWHMPQDQTQIWFVISSGFRSKQ